MSDFFATGAAIVAMILLFLSILSLVLDFVSLCISSDEGVITDKYISNSDCYLRARFLVPVFSFDFYIHDTIVVPVEFFDDYNIGDSILTFKTTDLCRCLIVEVD